MYACRRLLLLDVSMTCTGLAVVTRSDDGDIEMHLGEIDPKHGMARASLRDRRAYVVHGALASRLNEALRAAIAASKADALLAEVPAMGARNAGAMRSMALALAAWRIAADASRLPTYEYLRGDVLAAIGLRKGAGGDGKTVTRAMVRAQFKHDDPHDQMPDDSYDAAALLYAAREAGVLRALGWGDRPWEPIQ